MLSGSSSPKLLAGAEKKHAHVPLLFSLPGSYDTRGPHVNSPSHWKDVAILEDRANFKTTREQSRAVLVISPVQVRSVLSRRKAKTNKQNQLERITTPHR